MSLYFVRTFSQSTPERVFVILYSWTIFSSNADFFQMKSLLCKGVTATPSMPSVLSDSYSTMDILQYF